MELVWTTEKPTVPGWYLWCSVEDDGIAVDVDMGCREYTAADFDKPTLEGHICRECNRWIPTTLPEGFWWFGPIPEPQEVGE